MNTAKFKAGAVVIALLSFIALIVWQQSRASKLAAEAAALRAQLEQAAKLEGQNQRLTEQLRLAGERSQAESSELIRLRAQATTTRQLEQENIRLKAKQDHLAQRSTASSQPANNPYDQNHGVDASTRVRQAKHWGYLP